jgi:hypothetical protein
LDSITDHIEDHAEENPAPANVGKLMQELYDVEIVQNPVKTDDRESITQETKYSRLPRIPRLNEVAQRHDSTKRDSGDFCKGRLRGSMGNGCIPSWCERVPATGGRDFFISSSEDVAPGH